MNMYMLCLCEKPLKMQFFSEHEDGTLEFMAAPVALMPQNNMVSSALIKTVDGSFILHPVHAFNIMKALSNTETFYLLGITWFFRFSPFSNWMWRVCQELWCNKRTYCHWYNILRMDLQLWSNWKYRIKVQMNVQLRNLCYPSETITMCYQTKGSQQLTIMLKANLRLYPWYKMSTKDLQGDPKRLE